MLTIDGSMGEGGGQILRSSLALSLVTGQPFRIQGIRAGRRKPGLMRQHLTAVRAAAAVGDATVSGDAIGSQELVFEPGAVRGGDFRFAVGTAGSAGLVLQAVLPALLRAPEPVRLDLEGGTHNAASPPYDFLERVYLPWIRRMGPEIDVSLHQAGFYPAGGGRFTAALTPSPGLARLEVLDRGELRGISVRALYHNLPRSVPERELEVVQEKLPITEARVEPLKRGRGPGNALLVEVRSAHITELFTGFAEKGVPAEMIARRVVDEVRAYLASKAPVGPYLADQLLLPMALAGGGRLRTARPSRHTMTNIEVIRTFTGIGVSREEQPDGTVVIALG
ncbi:MAG: RNA 3'-terminal phosphate cyclase [Alphaproteobacteria bacterium]|nr:RNA 3'-terminal phosphate cyclase [Alphaproteobacteria bacterium]